MATVLDVQSSQDLLSDNRYSFRQPQQSKLFGRLNVGPHFDEGYVAVARQDPSAVEMKKFSLYYRVYNPSIMRSATDSPPLVVIHGGPSLPSNYLYPLAQQFSTSRSIIFYDQLGCGRSDQPKDRSMYSIEGAVKDLKELLRSLRLSKFHLLGHSFGGIVAYEYTKCAQNSIGQYPGRCLSLTLESTPSNMKTSLEECSRLEEEIRCELALGDAEADDSAGMVRECLRRRSECRLEEVPHPLAAAIEDRGTAFGAEEVSDYIARPPSGQSLPPTLLIRGQHDFVTERCIEGWREIFDGGAFASGRVAYREEEMMDCAHYCHLEDAQGFGDLVKGHCFINDY